MSKCFQAVIILFLISSVAHGAISPRVFNALNSIQEELAEAKEPSEFAEIERQILDIEQQLIGNSLGLSLTYQIHAQLYESIDQSHKAIEVLEKAYNLPSLDNSTLGQIGSSLAYMYFASGEYQKSISLLQEYRARSSNKISPNILALLSFSYFSLGDYKQGFPYIEAAINQSDTPNESWLVNAFAASYKLEDFDKALKFTNILIYNFPEKPDYWKQRSGLHQIQGQYRKAAIVSHAAFQQGYLNKESELYNLGVLMASEGAPYNIANALTELIDIGDLDKTEKVQRLLVQAWIQAKEFQRARAELTLLHSKYGNIKDGVLLLGYLIDAELWQDAINLSKNILERNPNLPPDRQLGSILLFKGISEFKLGLIKQSLITLGKSSGISETSGQAKSWMSHVNQMQG